MESVLLLINSAPSGPNDARAFATALQLRSLGHAVSVCLLQDAVFGGLKTANDGMNQRTADALRAGVAIYALGEDLALRGFTPHKLLEGVCVVDYPQLLDLLATHTRAIGAL